MHWENREFLADTNALLAPLGFTLGQTSWFFYPHFILWSVAVKGRDWPFPVVFSGQVDSLRHTPATMARAILWEAYREIWREVPATEIDYRPTETIPEDFYA